MTKGLPPNKTTAGTIDSLVEEIQHSKREHILLKVAIIISLVFLCVILIQEVPFLVLCKKRDRNIPPDTEMIVSACQDPHAKGVPGGKVLFVHEQRTKREYLLDLRTGEKRDVPDDPLLDPYGTFLTTDLVWLKGGLEAPSDSYYRPHYILDLINGQRYELLDMSLLPRLKNGNFNPENYSYIQSGERVFIYPSDYVLIALTSDFRTNQSGRVIFPADTIPLGNDTTMAMMKYMRADYEVIDLSLTFSNALSPTGKYDVRYDGIYFSKTRNIVVDHYMGNIFKSWYYDESGVIIQAYPSPWEFPKLPYPILKLRLPAP